MSNSSSEASGSKFLALWITVVVEGLVIIAVGVYNIYEIRRTSEKVQSKIEALSAFGARQGEKIDRLTAALEIYAGKLPSPGSLKSEIPPITEEQKAEQKERLRGLIKNWRDKGESAH
jgi:hypothetical protein